MNTCKLDHLGLLGVHPGGPVSIRLQILFTFTLSVNRRFNVRDVHVHADVAADQLIPVTSRKAFVVAIVHLETPKWVPKLRGLSPSSWVRTYFLMLSHADCYVISLEKNAK